MTFSSLQHLASLAGLAAVSAAVCRKSEEIIEETEIIGEYAGGLLHG